MKKLDPTFWLIKCIIPSAIVTVVLIYAATSFIRISDMWATQALVLLAILSFCALCVVSYLFVCSLASDASEGVKTALGNGMKRGVIAWFFVSLAIGAAAAFSCMKLCISIRNSILVGFITFLIFAFVPTLARRKKYQVAKEIEAKEDNQGEQNTSCDMKAEAETDDTDKSGLPTNFPQELNHYAIRVLFKELQEAQIVDANYRPINMTKTQMALLADAICAIFSIRNKWQVFEPFWGQKDMKQTLAQALRNDTQMSESVYQAFKKAQKDPKVGTIKAFAEWTEHYRKRYLQ